MRKHLSTKIKEIFVSPQGEGLYVGQKHIFVRFTKCNLNCEYCDTDFYGSDLKSYTAFELYEKLNEINCNVISLTGGEPLEDADFLFEFLIEYKNKLNKTIYLETNGTLYSKLDKLIDYIDIVAMDIKLKSATGEQNRFFDNEKFLKIAQKKDVFIKIVYDENITSDEINSVINIAKQNNTPLVLQPKMPVKKGYRVDCVFNQIYEKYQNIRLIPQVHKFLNLA